MVRGDESAFYIEILIVVPICTYLNSTVDIMQLIFQIFSKHIQIEPIYEQRSRWRLIDGVEISLFGYCAGIL